LVLQRGEHALGLFNFSRTHVTLDLTSSFVSGLQPMWNALTHEKADMHACALTPYAAIWLTAQRT
jgi:ActR/RegA family two-component response regulator